VSRVLHPTQHSISHFRDGLCRQNCTYT